MISIDLGSRAITTPGLDPTAAELLPRRPGPGAVSPAPANHRADRLPVIPENPLIFSPGPLAGIPQFPGTSKCMAVSLSPLTGIPGVSNFGGHFGAYLKYAGFDALEITGKSDTDVMIVIDGFQQGDLHDGSARSSIEVFDLEKAIVDTVRPGGPRPQGDRLSDDRHRRRPYHLRLHQQPLFRSHQARGRDQGALPDQAGRPDGAGHRDDGQEDPGHRRPGRISARRKSLRRRRLGEGETGGGKARRRSSGRSIRSRSRCTARGARG